MAYHLSGSGLGTELALRVQRQLPGDAAIEVGGAHFTTSDRGTKRRHLVAESVLSLARQRDQWRPYIGGGVGWTMAIDGPSPRRSNPAVIVAGGIDYLPAASGAFARLDVRARGMGTGFSGRTFTLLALLGYRR